MRGPTKINGDIYRRLEVLEGISHLNEARMRGMVKKAISSAGLGLRAKGMEDVVARAQCASLNDRVWLLEKKADDWELKNLQAKPSLPLEPSWYARAWVWMREDAPVPIALVCLLVVAVAAIIRLVR